MTFYQAYTPEDFQIFFYRQIGLDCVCPVENEFIWKHPEVGTIHSYGVMDRIQSGYGKYMVNNDFLVEYKYDSMYLHFGIIYKGITYSVVNDRLHPSSIPSSFVSVEKASGGINRWKSGQEFEGVELSVDYRYLQESLLPILDCDAESLSFLEENVRYLPLPDEMNSLLTRIERLLNSGRMTDALQTSITLELIALLLHPDNRSFFNRQEQLSDRSVQIGGRSIRLTKEDCRKIVQAHDLISEKATSFLTIYSLSRSLNISEQKLKAGFFDIYRQTLWDYSNNMRMRSAVELLRNTDQSICDISRQVGYQSQAAFNTMFKKWSGITPRQFRLQTQDSSCTRGEEKQVDSSV